MTKQKKATTNKLVLHYNNGTSYTIPRVTNFSLSEDGKNIRGCYTKTKKFYGITEHHKVNFDISLVDVTGFSYEAKHGEMSKSYQVWDGKVRAVTEWRNDEDYYCKIKDSRPYCHLTTIKELDNLQGECAYTGFI